MTLYQFKLLDDMEKAEAIWEGTFIGERSDGVHRILLYQIDGFYVEVLYHHHQSVINGLRSFSSVNQLEPYLDQIAIAKLL